MADKKKAVRPKVYNIIVDGEPFVGRTALINRFLFGNFVDYDDCTICEDYRKQVLISGRVAFVEICDPIGIAGSRMAHWRYQMRDADAAILVYSITSLATFERVTSMRDEMLAELARGSEQDREGGSGARGSSRGRSIPMCLVGNKSDRNIDREVSVKAGMQLAKDLGCSFFETTAKEGYNVDEAFYSLLRAVEEEKDEPDEQEPPVVGGFRGRLGRLSRLLGRGKPKS
ncbi:hypothetical protein O988_03558 [Pseudogymnoascus sp. VKM F-3808]|nr:hypothetical protein O988_03558 [Pseudogymnoascus sp. VKM F-3808]